MNTTTTLQRPGRFSRLLEPLVILIIVALCGLGILYVLEEQKSRESDRLQAIVDLQTRQVADWLRERQGDAEMVRVSPSLLEEYRLWLNQGDIDAAKRMQARLAPLLIKGGVRAIDLHDHEGRRVWSTLDDAHHTTPELLQGLRAANQTRQVQRVGPYLDDGGQIHLDYVVPLITNGSGEDSPLVVLHAGIKDWLCPTLSTWPNLSDTGESFLFRRDGDQVLYLCPLRHQSNAALRLRLPVSSPDLLAAQILRREALATETITGVDYRGAPVLGVAQAIAGTDWFVVAKLDLAEIRAATLPEILFIGLIGGLTLTTFLAGSRLLRNRQQLALATATQEAQTERLNALERLHESEQRFQAIFEQAAVGIALLAPDGRWLGVNQCLCEILGYEAAELLAKTFQDITYPDDLEIDLELVRRLLAGEIENYALEKRYIRKDGRPIWCHLTVSLVRTLDRQPDYFISVLKDISDRKAVESQIRLWSNVFEKAELNLAIGDAVRQRLLAVNPAFARRRGYRPEEMADLPVAALFPADRLDEIRAELRTADANGHHVFESEHVCKDGERFPVLLDITVTHSDDGRHSTRIVHALDITARKQAELELRASQQRFQDIVTASADWVWEVDAQIHYTYVSEGVQAVLGYRPVEILGRTPFDLMPPEEAARLVVEFGDILARRTAFRDLENINRHKDGHLLHIHTSGLPVLGNRGELLGYRGLDRDVTEKKRVDQELEHHRQHLEELVTERTAELTAARAEAERLARAKSEFLANMSHEIRTPMNAVLGLAYLLERLDLPKEARELARKIHLAGRSLLGIINDILDFSKIESGHIEIEHAPFRLDEVLDGLATIMTATAGNKPLELVIRPPDCLDCTLLGDSLRLGQILINLASNAIKFTAAGVVEVGTDLLERTESQILIRFSVRDTGIGIDEATQARLFQPFAQADASTTRRFGGSGLGLVISRRLVELMGGRLEVDSRLGEGSTFRFDLRFDVLDTVSSHLAGTARMRVLIVEDDPLVSEALAATVTALKWSATQVTSRHQALAKVLRDTTWQGADALVLLDHRPPELDGLAIATAIRQALPDSARPLLFLLTCARREQEPEPSGTVAIDMALSKPLTPSSLHDAVIQTRRQRLGGQPLTKPRMKTEHRLAGLRLLVVDDSDINRDVAQRIFSDEGAVVHLANDGREAVDWLMAHSEAVDIVLMDVQMPVMDGRAATRLIRETPSLPRLPIVALTADTVGDQQSAALEAGMDAFLSKPFDVTEAVALILSLATPPAVPHVVPATVSEPTPTTDAVEPTRETEDAPVRPESRADQDLDLPGIALDQGLDIWREPDLYRHYLRRFVRDYADSAQTIADAEPETARQLAHKLRGTAGNLGLPEVAAQAGALEKRLAAGLAVSVEALQDALTTALESIARYAPDTVAAVAIPPEVRPETSAEPPRAEVEARLREALSAFERFDPPAAGPALDALAAHLSTEQLAPLRQAVDEFDANTGTVAVRTLAETLSIRLES